MAERIDIVITDKVSPEPAKKLRQIASAALKADAALNKLKSSVENVDDTALTRLANASARLTETQAREVNATARLKTARAAATSQTDNAAMSSQRLAKEQVQAETATKRATQASNRARAALAGEEAASVRLAGAKNREAKAQNTAASAANRAATASLAAANASRRSASATQNTTYRTQNLIFQVQDVVTGLASGQKPLTVLIQQGLQIQGIFGPGTGVIGILRGVASAAAVMIAPFLPIIAIVGSIAGGFGILANEVSNTTDVAVGLGDTFRATIQLIVESISNILQPAVSSIGPYFTAAFSTVYNYILAATRNAINIVAGAFVGTISAIRGVWGEQFPAVFEAGWKTAFNAYLDGIQFLSNSALTLFSDQINSIVALYAGAYNSIVNVWNLLPAVFERLGSIAINALLGPIQQGARAVINALDSVFTFIGRAAELINQENPFADLLDASSINLEQYRRAVAPVGPSISKTISNSFQQAFSRDYATSIREAIDLTPFKQEISAEAQNAANIIENAYRDAFSTDFAGGAFNAIRQRSIQLARQRIAAETEGEAATKRANVELSTKQKLLADILKPLVDYRENSAALNELLREGAITLGQYNEALSSQTLVESLRDVDSTLENTAFANQSAIDEILIAAQRRLNIVQQAQSARIITEQEAADRILAINRQASADLQAIETARQSAILTSTSETFSALSTIAKGFAGDQSRIFKTLFVASKAFAIADSIIKIQQGIANAISLPFPANLAAVATVTAQAANIVSNIEAVRFAQGGRVSGPGGPRDDRILARLSDGEFVVNAAAASRNLALLEAINSGRDQVRYVPNYRDGGQVQQAFRSFDPVPRIGNDNVPQPNNVNINVYTRDPETRIEMSNTQRDIVVARRLNNAQRGL